MGGGRPYRAVTLGQDLPSPAQHLIGWKDAGGTLEGCVHQRGTTIRTETRGYLGVDTPVSLCRSVASRGGRAQARGFGLGIAHYLHAGRQCGNR
jgi:hypothetical protein